MRRERSVNANFACALSLATLAAGGSHGSSWARDVRRGVDQELCEVALRVGAMGILRLDGQLVTELVSRHVVVTIWTVVSDLWMSRKP